VNPNDTTDQRKAAMQKFGFETVQLDQPGAPTPGRIADSLGAITTALDQAVASGDLGAIAIGAAEVARLGMALSAWDDWRKSQKGDAPPLAEEFLEELRRVGEAQPGNLSLEPGDLDEDDEYEDEDDDEVDWDEDDDEVDWDEDDDEEEADVDAQPGAVKPGVTLRTVTEALRFLDSFDGYGMVATDEDLQVEGIREMYGRRLEDDYGRKRTRRHDPQEGE
jgi:hypothetical protein